MTRSSSKRFILAAFGLVLLGCVLWFFVLTSPQSRAVANSLEQIRKLTEPGGANFPRLETNLRITKGEGLPKELTGQNARLTLHGPSRLLLSFPVNGELVHIGRDANSITISAPGKDFAVEGRNDVPRFNADPKSIDPVELPELRFPLRRWQLFLFPATILAHQDEAGKIVFRLRPSFAARIGAPPDAVYSLRRDPSGFPAEIGYLQGETDVILSLENTSVSHLEPSSESKERGEKKHFVPTKNPPEPVALSHLVRFVESAVAQMNSRIDPLPQAKGSKTLLAVHGKGRLEDHDGARVLFLEGSPEEMGDQHGTLLKAKCRNLVDRIVYGVGVGSSLDKGRWFFGEIEEAQSRLEPFMDKRYLREMDALAQAAGMHPQESRLANFFPELFHCSGFALHGKATAGNRVFHGRVLDYLRGMGLEQNAVVMVVKPDIGHAWVNVGYAGFTGTVTAMNEAGIAIGEMGGRGEGNWDGKPMAQLMREVMEKAGSLAEAVEIMRKGPRTCEYYYVISDAAARTSVGIKATPEIFETIAPGQDHPQLKTPIEDTVLLSGPGRYEELVKRVRAKWGSFDAASARDLMTRPVSMNSNIQSVLFAPDTLDFWVANADSENVASATQYRRFNLRDLLRSMPADEKK